MYYECCPKARAWSTLESLCASAFTAEFEVTISYTSQEDFTFYVLCVWFCARVYTGMCECPRRLEEIIGSFKAEAPGSWERHSLGAKN